MEVNGVKCGFLLFKGDQDEAFVFSEDCCFKRKYVEKDLGVMVSANLHWTEHWKRRCNKAYAAFFMIKRNVSSVTTLLTKLNLFKSYLVPILTYGMQVCYANSTSLANLELFQKRATKLICSHGLNGYKSRLVKLGLLPISLYMELHDLLLFGKIIRGEYQIDWLDHVATIQRKRPTRSTNHENRQDTFYNQLTNLSVSKEYFWYRVVQLYSIIGKKVSIYSSNLKAELTVYYQEYFAIYYDYDDKKTWRVLNTH